MRHRLIITGLLIATHGTVFGGAVPVRPQGTAAPPAKKLLFLTHAALYKHSSLGPAEKAGVELGARGGFTGTPPGGYKQDSNAIDLAFLTPEYLGQFDGLMLMTNGNLPLTPAQKQLLIDYVRSGHALVGAHCATLTLYDYPAFGDLIGGYYRRSIVP